MSELRENIAKNISQLRRNQNWTQAELAEKLNYSDKAISKWERAEAVPDIEVLWQMADLFNVNIDYLCQSHPEEEGKKVPILYPPDLLTRRILQILLWVVTLFFLGTVIFVYQKIGGNQWSGLWICFIWPVPASCLLSTILFRRFHLYNAVPFALSATLWTLLAALFLQGIVLDTNLWLIFLIGVPLQIIIILAFWIRRGSRSVSEANGKEE